jgi:hypothetical protein
MPSRSSVPAVGDRVRVLDAFLDEDCSRPVVGTVEDVCQRPDWSQTVAFVVMFEHDDPMLPPGGEFTGDRLAPTA